MDADTADTEVTNEPGIEQPADTAPADSAPDASLENQEAEIVVTLAGEEPDAEAEQEKTAPAWVKEVRKRNRELERELKHIKAQQQQATAPQVPKLGPKPRIDDFDFDADRFSDALESWHAEKSKVEKAEAEAKQAEQAKASEWQAVQNTYAAERAKVPGAEEAEAVIKATFSDLQQAIILQATDGKAGTLIVALANSPKRLEKLAAIANPVKFAAEIGGTLRDVTVTPAKKPPPIPPTIPRAAAAAAGGSSLDMLREQALKTGDFSKYHEAKRAARKT